MKNEKLNIFTVIFYFAATFVSGIGATVGVLNYADDSPSNHRVTLTESLAGLDHIHEDNTYVLDSVNKANHYIPELDGN